MNVVLSAPGHLEHVGAEGERHDPAVLVTQDSAQGNRSNAILLQRLLRQDESAIDPGVFSRDIADLIAFLQLVIPLALRSPLYTSFFFAHMIV